jgi:hypothetical protein
MDLWKVECSITHFTSSAAGESSRLNVRLNQAGVEDGEASAVRVQKKARKTNSPKPSERAAARYARFSNNRLFLL